MTPRLFMATVLSQYGWVVAQEVIKSGRTLIDCDDRLQIALAKLRDAKPGSSEDVTTEIGQMSESLINMNIKLTGTRSTMHYLAESAHTLISGVSTFEQYIKARLSEWQNNADSPDLKIALHQLDSCKESIRDNDKLELVRKTMGQYKIDIKSLQQHIDISIGLASQSLHLLRFCKLTFSEPAGSQSHCRARQGHSKRHCWKHSSRWLRHEGFCCLDCFLPSGDFHGSMLTRFSTVFSFAKHF